MKRRLAIIVILLACVTMSCRRTDKRTVVIYVPEMKNRACVLLVGNSVTQELSRGDKNIAQAIIASGAIKMDEGNRTVSVYYESLQTAIKNLEHAVARVGFDAFAMDEDGKKSVGVPAYPEAVKNLPPECK